MVVNHVISNTKSCNTKYTIWVVLVQESVNIISFYSFLLFLWNG